MSNQDEVARTKAQERMFEVELAEALDSPPELAMPIDEGFADSAAPKARVARTWLGAAAALLGLAVTVLVAWQQSQPAVTAQDPVVPMPLMPRPEIIFSQKQLATFAAESQNLLVNSVAFESYEALTRFAELRRLQISGSGVKSPTKNALVPLGKLQQLEELNIPLQSEMAAEHLHAIAAAAKLHTLTLRLLRALTVADVKALKRLPQLRTLQLQGGEVDAATIRSLSDLPHLDDLQIRGVNGCTEEVLVNLRTIHRLRRVGLAEIGEVPLVEQLSGKTVPGAGLTPAVARALGELPLLEDVSFFSCQVTTAAIGALPTSLRGIDITYCPDVTSADLLALRRCRGLQRLHLDSFSVRRWPNALPQGGLRKPDDTAAAQATLIRDLPLTQLGFTGAMPEAVRTAVAAKATLTDVTLHWFTRENLATVGQLKSLQRLTLISSLTTKPKDTALLAPCESLQELVILHCYAGPELVVGHVPGVAVTGVWLR